MDSSSVLLPSLSGVCFLSLAAGLGAADGFLAGLLMARRDIRAREGPVHVAVSSDRGSSDAYREGGVLC